MSSPEENSDFCSFEYAAAAFGLDLSTTYSVLDQSHKVNKRTIFKRSKDERILERRDWNEDHPGMKVEPLSDDEYDALTPEAKEMVAECKVRLETVLKLAIGPETQRYKRPAPKKTKGGSDRYAADDKTHQGFLKAVRDMQGLETTEAPQAATIFEVHERYGDRSGFMVTVKQVLEHAKSNPSILKLNVPGGQVILKQGEGELNQTGTGMLPIDQVPLPMDPFFDSQGIAMDLDDHFDELERYLEKDPELTPDLAPESCLRIIEERFGELGKGLTDKIRKLEVNEEMLPEIFPVEEEILEREAKRKPLLALIVLMGITLTLVQLLRSRIELPTEKPSPSAAEVAVKPTESPQKPVDLHKTAQSPHPSLSPQAEKTQETPNATPQASPEVAKKTAVQPEPQTEKPQETPKPSAEPVKPTETQPQIEKPPAKKGMEEGEKEDSTAELKEIYSKASCELKKISFDFLKRRAKRYGIPVPPRLQELVDMKYNELIKHMKEFDKKRAQLEKEVESYEKPERQRVSAILITEINAASELFNKTQQHLKQWQSWKAPSADKQKKKELQIKMLAFRKRQLSILLLELKFLEEHIRQMGGGLEVVKFDLKLASERHLEENEADMINQQKDKALRGEQRYMYDYRKKCWERILKNINSKKH